MTSEIKQIFTRRIVSANRTQLVVILYEMLLTYLEEAKNADEAGNKEELVRSLEAARGCVKELRTSLNFDYEPAKSLFSIYCFADRELANMAYARKIKKKDSMDALTAMFEKLRGAYAQISAQDTSEPLMDNAQDVYAGFTYGKTDVNESLSNYDKARGYTV